VPFVVKLDESAVPARLTIPAKFLRTAADSRPDASRKAELSSPRTIVAGIALSLAAVGMVFVIRRGRETRAAVLLIVGGLSLATASYAWADLAPPKDFDPKGLIGPIPDSARVMIEVVGSGEAVVLTISPGELAGDKPADAPPGATPAVPKVGSPRPVTATPKAIP
jgi:hypothetical protein